MTPDPRVEAIAEALWPLSIYAEGGRRWTDALWEQRNCLLGVAEKLFASLVPSPEVPSVFSSEIEQPRTETPQAAIGWQTGQPPDGINEVLVSTTEEILGVGWCDVSPPRWSLGDHYYGYWNSDWYWMPLPSLPTKEK